MWVGDVEGDEMIMPVRIVVLCIVSSVFAVVVVLVMHGLGFGKQAPLGAAVGAAMITSALLAVWLSETDEDEADLEVDEGA